MNLNQIPTFNSLISSGAQAASILETVEGVLGRTQADRAGPRTLARGAVKSKYLCGVRH